ncbi:hypothetical protein INT48_008452 [Thamnidium elegans]|uniref:DDE Tnp4 domain-containing protein n=1 Tax=Thamnidium elegans TaxID=101142 RepID=A0A8H7VW71_9FUNG|nr:hypothetical protein INT48_008452 [Thamnidium elegans]
MPKVSVRQKKIATLQEKVQYNRREIAKRIASAPEEEWDSVVDKSIDAMIFDESFLELSQVLSSRYLPTGQRNNTNNTRISPNTFDYDAFISDEEKFAQTVRMTRENFDSLVNELKDHEVYQSKGLRPQSDFKVQIALVLDRIGSRGIGNSVGRLARSYGVSEGSVVKFTKRFFEAVVSLQTKYLSWPTDEEKTEIKSVNAEKTGFKDCIGIVDGMTADLAWKPSERAKLFLSGKEKYSLQSISICDQNKKIRYLETGFYGSRHDSEVYSDVDICKHPAKYFSGNEYLLGDSKYILTEQIITPFNNPYNMDPDKKRFNRYHDSMRETIDQTFSILKKRFQSLCELPLQIKNMTTDITFAQQWILVCVLLHNRLITLGGADIDLEENNSEQVVEEESGDDDNDSETHQLGVAPRHQIRCRQK